MTDALKPCPHCVKDSWDEAEIKLKAQAMMPRTAPPSPPVAQTAEVKQIASNVLTEWARTGSIDAAAEPIQQYGDARAAEAEDRAAFNGELVHRILNKALQLGLVADGDIGDDNDTSVDAVFQVYERVLERAAAEKAHADMLAEALVNTKRMATVCQMSKGLTVETTKYGGIIGTADNALAAHDKRREG